MDKKFYEQFIDNLKECIKSQETMRFCNSCTVAG